MPGSQDVDQPVAGAAGGTIAGFDSHLIKPVEPRDVVELLRGWRQAGNLETARP